MHNAHESLHLQMTLLSTKVKNIAMMCTALAIIMASAVYIIGEQQKIGGLRHHRRDHGKVSRVLRFMSPELLSNMREKEEEEVVNSSFSSTGQYTADHHEEERNLGKRGRKKKQKRKKRKKKKQKAKSLKGGTTTHISINTIKDAVVESFTEPKQSSKSGKEESDTQTVLSSSSTSYNIRPFQKDTVSVW